MKKQHKKYNNKLKNIKQNGIQINNNYYNINRKLGYY